MTALPTVYLLGSKPGAVAALEILLRRGWPVRAVVPSPWPDWHPGPTLLEAATRHRIAVTTHDALPLLGEVDYVISYMYRSRVRAPVLALARGAALNFHAGPLPEFGGWAFYNVAILEQSPEYGCTCHHMDEAFDTGPLAKVNRFPIFADRETALSLERRTQIEMIRLFIEICDLVESGGELARVPQPRERMRYMSRSEFSAMKEIPAGASAEEIDRRARAFWYPPYEGAHILHGEQRIEVIPRLAREQIARGLHTSAYEDLKAAAQSK